MPYLTGVFDSTVNKKNKLLALFELFCALD